MQKKTVSFFLIGLVATLLVAVLVALYLIDWNQYRSTLADLVSERLGVRVELAGDLRLEVLPRPSISAEFVRLSPLQAQFDETIATADRIDMRLGFVAALSGNITLQSLSLDGVSIALTEAADGWRLRGWPESEPNDETAGSNNSFAALDRVEIKGGTITANRLDGSVVELEGINLSLSGALPAGPVEWSGDVVVAGSPLAVSGRIVPVKSRGETSVRADIEVAGATIDVSVRVTPAGDMTGRVQASGKSIQQLAAFAARASNVAAPTAMPDLGFALDMQIERERGVNRLVSRQLSVGETHGVVDVTLVEKGAGYHVTGTVTLGVIALGDVFSNANAASAPVQSAVGAPSGIDLDGAIDITVEGVEYRNGLIQQVNAVIGFKEGAPYLSQFSALLPGASRVVFAANNRSNGGDVTFSSGRLPEVFKWMDIPISEAVPSGRLATADLRATISIADENWMMSDVKGSIDTSKIEAELSGRMVPFAASSARINIDQLNLDAYWPEPVLPAFNGDEPLVDMDLALNVGTLHWLRRSFTGLKTRISIMSGDILMPEFVIKQGSGSLSGAVFLRGGADDQDVEASVKLVNWQYPIIHELLPDVREQIDGFANKNSVSGTISATGPIQGMQLQASLTAGDNKAEFAGTVGLGDAVNTTMQGTLVHTNVWAVMPVLPARVSPHATLPVTLTLNVNGTADNMAFRASGQASNAQLDVSGRYSPASSSIDFSMNMPTGVNQNLQQVMGPYGGFLDAKKPSRARFAMQYANNDISLSNIDIRNGSARVAGAVRLQAQKISGDLALADLDLARMLDGAAQSVGFDEGDATESLPLNGEVKLNLSNVVFMGQKLTAPKAVFVAVGGTNSFRLGDGAILNGKTVVGEAVLGGNTTVSSVQLKSATLDAGQILAAAGITKSISGLITTDMHLTTLGSTPKELLAGLKGEVTFSGGAGSMYFMAVPKIVATISSADSKTSFLRSIGGFLRSGETEFAQLNGTLRFDGGVALVDEIALQGGWGQFTVQGQANLVNDLLAMTGELKLTQPQDAPAIPVAFGGKVTAPTTNWTSGAIERFAIAGVERRLRTELFGVFDKAQKTDGDAAPASPGSAVVGAAVDLLSRLREAQNAKKKGQTGEAETEKPNPGNR